MTQTDPADRRGWLLLLAVVGLAHSLVYIKSGYLVYPLMGEDIWTAEGFTACHLVELCFVAFVAWFAYVVRRFPVEITVLPQRWRALGGWFIAWCVVQECWTTFNAWRWPELYELIGAWMRYFVVFGELRFGWLAAAVLVAALAEEIAYRGLLFPALEGLMDRRVALVLHAAVFELTHAFIYGQGLTGVPFVGGIVLGWAFQRTRSLAVPTLLHAGHNLLYFSAVWYFNS